MCDPTRKSIPEVTLQISMGYGNPRKYLFFHRFWTHTKKHFTIYWSPPLSSLLPSPSLRFISEYQIHNEHLLCDVQMMNGGDVPSDGAGVLSDRGSDAEVITMLGTRNEHIWRGPLQLTYFVTYFVQVLQ